MSTSPTASPHQSPSNPSTTTTSSSEPSTYNLDEPTDALSSYARTMHAHTLSQLSLVQRDTRASTRRTSAPESAPSSNKRGGDAQPVSAIGVLREESSVGSVDSVAS
ncbi:MAG: hypothetical protein OHK93_003922 [Ramalina farinacea]|uniref:Uncharacterized protein n=1 Tax=Ramalina farinacea TaxID=258253 RepID=A0AA43TRL0_9LECA|nr:hypothetical protein [Ramalina farinacea]